MNRIRTRWTSVLAALTALTLSSCLDDNNDDYSLSYPTALVTLKHSPADGTFFMQLDDSTTLRPINVQQSPYGEKEVRALVNYTSEEVAKTTNRSIDVHVNWIDTIRTKPMDINRGVENMIVYGNDPLEIVNDWTTVVEDGYMTLRFRTYLNMGGIHYLHLVKGDNPYEVILYHNAGTDVHGGLGDGIIAFCLNNLPDTNGETVDLTLKWQSFSGEKSAKFKYRSRP